MIVYRNADPRFPFLWENADQPAARWHGMGEGPVQYFADTPDGAWAEFVRHEGITQEAELVNVRRSLWAIELPDDLPAETPALPIRILTGGRGTYQRCRQEARHYSPARRADGRSKQASNRDPPATDLSLRCSVPAPRPWAGPRHSPHTPVRTC